MWPVGGPTLKCVFPSQAVPEPDLELMRQIDALYLQWPFYGSRRLCVELQHQGYGVNRKRVQQLMRKMGIQAIYPKPRMSQPGKGHKIYPYRLRGLNIDRPNQVGTSDIYYIPKAEGFMYLTVIMDWYSRRVLAWRVSNTLETESCLEALEESLERYGIPEMFNTDQGAQFTSEAFTGMLSIHGVPISMDGKGDGSSMSLLNACGAAGNTRTCISEPMKPQRLCLWDSLTIFDSTIRDAATKP